MMTINRFAFVVLAGVILAIGLSVKAGDYPGWWQTRGVVYTNSSWTNDYAAANQGQVKWIATNAFDELNAHLPGGAGSAVLDTIKNFSITNNYKGINAGQLKHLAAPFYDRLIQTRYTRTYPWPTNNPAQASDYSMVNIGQVKNTFSFDPATVTFYGAISGTVFYSQSQTGCIWVVAATSLTGWASANITRIDSPGNYVITNVFLRFPYWVKSYRDSNGNQNKDDGEAQGAHLYNPVTPMGSVGEINIILSDDPDTDGDGLTDIQEGEFGTSATNVDTDGDGIPDSEEIYVFHTDPTNNDTTFPTVSILSPINGERKVWFP